MALHDIIIQATGNQRLITLMNNLAEQMYRYRFEYIKDFSIHKQLIDEHRVIYESLESKNVDASVASAKNHIDNQAHAIIRQIRLEQKKKQ